MSLLLYGNIRKGSAKYVAKVQQNLFFCGVKHDLFLSLRKSPDASPDAPRLTKCQAQSKWSLPLSAMAARCLSHSADMVNGRTGGNFPAERWKLAKVRRKPFGVKSKRNKHSGIPRIKCPSACMKSYFYGSFRVCGSILSVKTKKQPRTLFLIACFARSGTQD